jgi:glycosyltransferase involved in cell wall biosynthesis
MTTPRFVVASNGKFHAFALCAALARRGLLERFYTPYYSQCDRFVARFVRRQDKESIPLERVRTNVWTELPPRLGRHLPGIRRYADYLKAVWFDRWVSTHLVHERADVFIGWSNSSLQSLDVARRHGMRTVLTRGSSHIDYQLDLLAQEHAKRGLAFRPAYGIAERERREYTNAQYVRIPSSYVRRTFVERGISDSKLLLLPYAADLSHFSPQPRTDRSTFRVLLLNAVNLRKGFYYAQAMIEHLNAKIRAGIEFWFIGTPEAGVAPHLRALREKWANVILLGHINHYELARAISQCDVGVFPSIEEGMATVVPQTMACGVPVIATINTGAEDLVNDGVEGFLVPIMDAPALAERVQWCFDHRVNCWEMGRAAAQRVSSWTWDDVVDALVKSLDR